jgi:hypothetical protein
MYCGTHTSRRAELMRQSLARARRRKEANSTALKGAEDRPKVVSEPTQAVTDSMITESGSELRSESEPEVSSDQKVSNDD